MSNHLHAVLQEWQTRCDTENWVLGVVYLTEGPCYRKAGAMMLISDAGGRLGLLSGGCLEADIQLHARKVMHTGLSTSICYDGSDEDDISFQMGIGCGGTVHILLTPVNQGNNYLCLQEAYRAMNDGDAGMLRLMISWNSADTLANFKVLKNVEGIQKAQYHQSTDASALLDILTEAEPHILIVGGGVDAIPVVSIADSLGWKVSLWDPRPANARPEHFKHANIIADQDVKSLASLVKTQNVSGVILMSHNIALDADALSALKHSSLKYLGLLGPVSRRKNVLLHASLKESDVATTICGPAGHKLGGELPESIALSILAECHACLNAVSNKVR